MREQKLAIAEAMWDTCMLYEDRSVRAMQRSPWVLSPNLWAVKKWDMLILVAMLYVSTVTPYEVSQLSKAVIITRRIHAR